jgi:hypothetical protein
MEHQEQIERRLIAGWSNGILDTEYRFEGPGVREAVTEAMASCSLAEIIYFYIRDMLQAWEMSDVHTKKRFLPNLRGGRKR